MDFNHKTLIIIAILAFLFFWGCNGEKKIKSGNYFISLEEKTFLLPDTIFYPTVSVVFEDQFIFLDAKGQNLLSYDSTYLLKEVWPIKDRFFGIESSFNQLFKHSENQIILYSSLSRKAILMNRNFSSFTLIDLADFPEEIIFPNLNNLVEHNNEILLPAIDYTNNQARLKIIGFNPDSISLRNILIFDQDLPEKIPLMFYVPSILSGRDQFLAYFPTLDSPITFNTKGDQLIRQEIFKKGFVDTFDKNKFEQDPFYIFEFDFYYYALGLDSSTARLMNQGLDRDNMKVKLGFNYLKNTDGDNFFISISDSLFHKSATVSKMNGYFLNSNLKNKQENYIYLVEFGFEDCPSCL